MSMMYTLTQMTGKEASANRTVIWGTVEFNYRVLLVLLCASPIALLSVAFAWPFIGQISIVMIPIVEGFAYFLIHRREAQGLRLRTYQALWDKKKADLNSFMLCAQKIDIGTSDYRTLVSNTVPYVRPEPAPSTALMDRYAEMAHEAREHRGVDESASLTFADANHRGVASPADSSTGDGIIDPAPSSAPSPSFAMPRDDEDYSTYLPPTAPVREPSHLANRGARPPAAATLDPLDRSLIGREKGPDVPDVSAWLDVERASEEML